MKLILILGAETRYRIECTQAELTLLRSALMWAAQHVRRQDDHKDLHKAYEALDKANWEIWEAPPLEADRYIGLKWISKKEK